VQQHSCHGRWRQAVSGQRAPDSGREAFSVSWGFIASAARNLRVAAANVMDVSMSCVVGRGKKQ
jgi:hypothetical protein